MSPDSGLAAGRFLPVLLGGLCAAGIAAAAPLPEEVYVPIQAKEVQGYLMVEGVNARTGNFARTYPAFGAHGVSYRRTYNSNADNRGAFGFAWGSSFDTRAIGMPDKRVAVLENGNGALTVYGRGPEGETLSEMEQAVAAAAKNPSDAPREYIGTQLGIENAFAQEDAAGCGDAILGTMESGYVRHTCAGRFEFFDTKGRLMGFKEETSGHEHTVEIARDASGRITAVSDDEGHKLGFVRTATTLKVTDETGYWVNYEFDARGRNTRITESDAPAYAFDYNAAGLLTRITYIDSTSIDIAYDDSGRAAKLTTREGNVFEFRYRPDAQETLVIQRPYKGEPAGMLLKFLD